MDIQIATLCDFAADYNGKLVISGTFDTLVARAVPVVHPSCALAMRMCFTPEDAGLGDYGEFVSADWAKVRAVLSLNIEALTHLTHALLPPMIRCGHGAVIHVSSLASLLPLPDLAVYAATKAYVTSFSEALRIELKPHGIPVVAVCPGPVQTEFGAAARRHAEARELPGHRFHYVPKEQVVAEALTALDRNRARVYPGLRTAAAACLIAALPIALIRLVMATRPRRE